MNIPSQSDRTHWMAGRYGLMVHWIYPHLMGENTPPAASLDDAVNQFNLERFLQDFAATGADWLIFTLGQNSGYYASPNSVIEQLAGKDRCSKRDLALEIANGVHDLGKRFIAYLPCEVAGNRALHEGFAWNTQEGTDQAAFQTRYLSAVREWAERLGPLMDGWWYDGCYQWPLFHNDYMDWPAWFEASRAGNPDRVVAFNDGSLCNGLTQPLTPQQDYLSGETEVLVNGRIRLGRPATPQLLAYGDQAQTVPEPIPTFLPDSRFVPGTNCQWHCLLPVDCFWGHGNGTVDWLPSDLYHVGDPESTATQMEPPLYADDELAGFLTNCLTVGGAVTMNVGIYQEGHLGLETVRQLASVRRRKSL
jgi:hypothetical protein